MSHIHSEPGQHDLTVSAFIVNTTLSEPRIILHRHKKLGMYLQFGGHVELDEHLWDSIGREILEESGYHLSQLSLIQPKERLKQLTRAVTHPIPLVVNTHKFDDEHFHSDLSYAFTTDQEPASAIAEDESDEIQVFTKTELEKLSKDKIIENVREIALFILGLNLSQWDLVKADSF